MAPVLGVCRPPGPAPASFAPDPRGHRTRRKPDHDTGNQSLHLRPQIQLGQIVATPGAISACSPQHLTRCLHRHSRGDWGNVCAEDKALNDQALVEGERVLSAYAIDESKPAKWYGDNCLWIITERDRSVTTFLLPDEY